MSKQKTSARREFLERTECSNWLGLEDKMNFARSSSRMGFDERMGLIESEQYHAALGVSFDNECLAASETGADSSGFGDALENISSMFDRSDTRMPFMGNDDGIDDCDCHQQQQDVDEVDNNTSIVRQLSASELESIKTRQAQRLEQVRLILHAIVDEGATGDAGWEKRIAAKQAELKQIFVTHRSEPALRIVHERLHMQDSPVIRPPIRIMHDAELNNYKEVQHRRMSTVENILAEIEVEEQMSVAGWEDRVSMLQKELRALVTGDAPKPLPIQGPPHLQEGGAHSSPIHILDMKEQHEYAVRQAQRIEDVEEIIQMITNEQQTAAPGWKRRVDNLLIQLKVIVDGSDPNYEDSMRNYIRQPPTSRLAVRRIANVGKWLKTSMRKKLRPEKSVLG
uniref:Uncharacterized protein n=1 Tax=Plectus sambesii TaxID=2011161 RepID=A0A914VKE9_9BILA